MRIAKLLWRRLPHIALYTAAAFLILLIGREAYRSFAPGDWYLNYSRYTVESVPEGENIPYEACRSRIGTFEIRGGARTIFKIVNTQKPEEQVIVDAVEYPAGTTTTKRQCVKGFVDVINGKDKVDLEPGNYIVSHVVRFKVSGVFSDYNKETEIKSNIFNISEKSMTPDDIKEKIDELQKEIEDLKKQLRTAYESCTRSCVDPTLVMQQQKEQSQPAKTTAPEPVTPVEDKKQTVKVVGIPVCVPLTGVCLTQ